MNNECGNMIGEYIAIEALKNVENIIDVTRIKGIVFHHAEIFDNDEVLLTQFIENTSDAKLRGKAVIYYHHREKYSGE